MARTGCHDPIAGAAIASGEHARFQPAPRAQKDRMFRSSIPLACLALLPIFGCAADSSTSAAGGKTPATAETISVYHGTGSVQCNGGGVPLADHEQTLAAAGIRVLSSSCGTTGRMYAAVCGAMTGEIHIFEIPASQKDAAAKLEFTPLSTLPGAQKRPCA